MQRQRFLICVLACFETLVISRCRIANSLQWVSSPFKTMSLVFVWGLACRAWILTLPDPNRYLTIIKSVANGGSCQRVAGCKRVVDCQQVLSEAPSGHLFYVLRVANGRSCQRVAGCKRVVDCQRAAGCQERVANGLWIANGLRVANRLRLANGLQRCMNEQAFDISGRIDRV